MYMHVRIPPRILVIDLVPVRPTRSTHTDPTAWYPMGWNIGVYHSPYSSSHGSIGLTSWYEAILSTPDGIKKVLYQRIGGQAIQITP
jgi:hypothetical protein